MTIVGIVCSICQYEPAVVRSVITNPLVDSVNTFVCLDCYSLNAAATAAVLASDSHLVHTECAV